MMDLCCHASPVFSGDKKEFDDWSFAVRRCVQAASVAACEMLSTSETITKHSAEQIARRLAEARSAPQRVPVEGDGVLHGS